MSVWNRKSWYHNGTKHWIHNGKHYSSKKRKYKRTPNPNPSMTYYELDYLFKHGKYAESYKYRMNIIDKQLKEKGYIEFFK